MQKLVHWLIAVSVALYVIAAVIDVAKNGAVTQFGAGYPWSDGAN